METRSEVAAENKRSGAYNCAQAVACAYHDIVGVDEETLKTITASFGTGMGNMDGTCGALVGAGVILGLAKRDRVVARAAMKRVMDGFKAKNGATVCRDLKGIDTKCVLRECNGCVADAADLLAREL